MYCTFVLANNKPGSYQNMIIKIKYKDFGKKIYGKIKAFLKEGLGLILF